MKAIIIIFWVVMVFVLMYATMSFIKLDINFMNWSEPLRSFYIFLSYLFSALAITIYNEHLKNNK